MLEEAVRKAAAWVRRKPGKAALLYAAVYLTWFYLLEKFRDPVIIVHSAIDDRIPFVPVFILPYLAWFFYIAFVMIWFYLHSREDFWHVSRYMCTGMILALVIYTIVPTGLELRQEVTGTDLFSGMVALLYQTDTATNVCPSIHVMNSIAVNVVVQRSDAFAHPFRTKTASYLLAILICLSTVLLKQHSVIDVFWAIVMEAVLYSLSYRSFFEKAGATRKKIA